MVGDAWPHVRQPSLQVTYGPGAGNAILISRALNERMRWLGKPDGGLIGQPYGADSPKLEARERGDRMTQETSAPRTSEALRAAILERYDGLSKRLRQFARYVLDEPHDLAFETLAAMTERCGVQPSAIVRFAQSFGFEGATQMQRLFRDDLLSTHPTAAYRERVRAFSNAVDERPPGQDGLLAEFADGNSLALSNLPNSVSEADLASAVSLLEQAAIVYATGFRRAFPVAAYLAYSIQQAGKRTFFVDGVAGLARQQIRNMSGHDLLIAVSYSPYAEETVEAVAAAASKHAKIISITDSPVSPIAKPADVVLLVKEAEIRGFRSLSASMCLAQALMVEFAVDIERQAKRRGTPAQRPRRTRKA